MKTYNQLVTEFFRESDKAKRKFVRVAKDIDTHYPGVNQFFYAASKWGHEISSLLDKELYNILNKIKHRKSVESLSQNDLRNVYKFLIKRKLESYEDMERLFIEAIGDE